MYFELLPQHFTTEQKKIAFMISHLTGRAQTWATAECTRRSTLCESIFSRAFAQRFSPGREAARSPTCLRQGRRSVIDYAIEFRTLAADSGWNNATLVDAYISGLSQRIRKQLISLDLPDELDSVIPITSKTDRRLQDYEKGRVEALFSPAAAFQVFHQV